MTEDTELLLSRARLGWYLTIWALWVACVRTAWFIGWCFSWHH